MSTIPPTLYTVPEPDSSDRHALLSGAHHWAMTWLGVDLLGNGLKPKEGGHMVEGGTGLTEWGWES